MLLTATEGHSQENPNTLSWVSGIWTQHPSRVILILAVTLWRSFLLLMYCSFQLKIAIHAHCQTSLAHPSDSSSKKKQNLWGRVWGNAKSPSHRGQRRERREVVLLSMKCAGHDGWPSANHSSSLGFGGSSTEGGAGMAHLPEPLSSANFSVSPVLQSPVQMPRSSFCSSVECSFRKTSFSIFVVTSWKLSFIQWSFQSNSLTSFRLISGGRSTADSQVGWGGKRCGESGESFEIKWLLHMVEEGVR